jgi:beta-lactamase class A
MRRILALLALAQAASLLASAQTASPQPASRQTDQRTLPRPPAGTESLAALQQHIERIRSTFPGEMSVYMKNPKTGDLIALDADRVMETFSVIKVPIMVEVLRQAEAGKFTLADRVKLQASDRRLPSGMLYVFDPGLDPTVRDLLTFMIIISDNEATDLLADKVGRANVTHTMQTLGLPHTTIEFSDLDWDRLWLGRLDPSYKTASGDQTVLFPFDKYTHQQVADAFRQTIYDSGIYFGHSTTREIGTLLEKMEHRDLVSPAASDLMIDILKKQEVNNRFPKYLSDVVIAHKTGDGQPTLANDAGILWVQGQPIVLVVFTGHHRGTTSALHDAIARVAANVARHYGAHLSPDYKEKQ